jgi:hypothetical protein
MICLFGMAFLCAAASTVETMPRERTLWAAAALGWAAIAVLAFRLE